MRRSAGSSAARAGYRAVAGANMAGGDATYQRRVFLDVSEFCGLDFCGVGAIVPGQPNVEETVIRDSRGG